MKSITVHKIDDATERLLVKRAESEGVSLNQMIKKLLREALGVNRAQVDRRADFEEFCGSWSESEAAEFEDITAQFSEIDEEVWK